MLIGLVLLVLLGGLLLIWVKLRTGGTTPSAKRFIGPIPIVLFAFVVLMIVALGQKAVQGDSPKVTLPALPLLILGSLVALSFIARRSEELSIFIQAVLFGILAIVVAIGHGMNLGGPVRRLYDYLVVYDSLTLTLIAYWILATIVWYRNKPVWIIATCLCAIGIFGAASSSRGSRDEHAAIFDPITETVTLDMSVRPYDMFLEGVPYYQLWWRDMKGDWVPFKLEANQPIKLETEDAIGAVRAVRFWVDNKQTRPVQPFGGDELTYWKVYSRAGLVYIGLPAKLKQERITFTMLIP